MYSKCIKVAVLRDCAAIQALIRLYRLYVNALPYHKRCCKRMVEKRASMRKEPIGRGNAETERRFILNAVGLLQTSAGFWSGQPCKYCQPEITRTDIQQPGNWGSRQSDGAGLKETHRRLLECGETETLRNVLPYIATH